jgi:hypothetical protein
VFNGWACTPAAKASTIPDKKVVETMRGVLKSTLPSDRLGLKGLGASWSLSRTIRRVKLRIFQTGLKYKGFIYFFLLRAG